MNLLSVLLKALLSKEAIKALANKTGLDGRSLKKLLPLAIPVLMKMLTKMRNTQYQKNILKGLRTRINIPQT